MAPTISQTEESLRQSDEKYRLLVENLNVGVFQSTLSGTFLHVNRAVAQIAGYDSAEEFMRVPAQKLYADPNDRQRLIEALKEHGAVAGQEMRSVKKTGTIYWIAMSAVLLKDQAGQPHSILGIVEDIAERNHSEEALRKSEKHARALLNAIPDLMFRLSRQGVFLDYKADHKDLYTQATSIIGKYNRDLTPPEFAGLIERQINTTLATGQMQTFDYQLPIPGRGVCDYEARMVASGADEVIAIVRDTTEKRKLLENLQKHQKLESLGVLAGGIAHDFNNLLSGIFGYVDLAQAATTDDIVSEHLTSALSVIDRAKGLTQQLLTFAKGGVPIRKIGALFPFIEETAKFALSGSNVAYLCHIPDGIWLCDFDKNQIGQVIDNIVINAKQAMPMGGTIVILANNIVLNAQEHVTLTSGNFVRISIKDSGVGIPREILPRIFDPFFTTKPKGSGLGLATAYSIVNRHGGAIDVVSASGQGTTFHIYLPAVQVRA